MNHKYGIWRCAVCLLVVILLSTCGPAKIPTQQAASPTTEIGTQNTTPVPVTKVPEIDGSARDVLCDDPELDFDSDQDGLCDRLERKGTLTDPNSLDTDKDGLSDGQEVTQYKTSPLLGDTDGDGLTDYEEIKNGGTSPLLADMPQLSIELFGNPSIDVNYTVNTSMKSVSVEFIENKGKTEDTKAVKTNLSIENNTKLHAEVEASTKKKGWPPSASAKLTTDTTFSAGYFQNTSSNWEQNSIESIQKTYEKLNKEDAEYSVGKLSVAMKITNLSGMSIRLKNLVVNVYQPDKTVIGNIKPNPDTWPGGGNLLKPGGSITIILENEKIPAQKVQTILENPTALIFEVASYEMYMGDKADPETSNFDILAQNVIKQTGMISINYGDGTIERYLVATNVGRNSNGSATGVTLEEVLSEIIGLDYEACPQVDANSPTGIMVLCKLEDREQFDYRDDGNDHTSGYGFWTVGGTGAQFGVSGPKDFDAIQLKPKQSIYLVYFKDSDGDNIFDTDEYLLGTDKDRMDTDGDGLTDSEETKIGWEVRLTDKTKLPYRKTSDPLIRDWDGDSWNDSVERDNKTDPELADTDGDRLNDNQDPRPLGTCLEDKRKSELGLVAWWQPEYDDSSKAYIAQDVWATNDPRQNGDLEGYDLAEQGQEMVFLEGDVPYFSFNRGLNSDDQYMKVESDEFLSLTDMEKRKDFTFAADIIWDGVYESGEDRATLVSKGSTFGLYITKDGAITFTLHRRASQRCWVDAIVKIDCLAQHKGSRDVLEELTAGSGSITAGQQHRILVTFTDDRMRIYIDGVLQAEKNTAAEWYEWPHTFVRDFKQLITNKDPFVIGNTLEEGVTKWAFKGRIANIQFYNAKMIPDNVTKLYQYGLCTPTQ